jgi:glycosyltransferase involved in cell wall biosynthesis
MKKVAIICDNPLQSQPRLLTEVNALKGTYKILLFGEESTLPFPFFKLRYFNNHPLINFHFKWPPIIRKPVSFLISAYLLVYRLLKAAITFFQKRNNSKILTEQAPDLVIMHGMAHADWVHKTLKSLKIPLVINMHEYYPLEFEDSPVWMRDVKPVYDRTIRLYCSNAQSYFVVCNSIIKKYEEEFGLKNQVLIRNAKPFRDIQPKLNNQGIIRMIHHGASISSRKIELTIDCMKFLPENYHLDFMLVPNATYYQALVDHAKADKRIRFLPIIPTTDIPAFISQYDLGLFLLPPTNFNYLHALPNKLFEFIQARLAIVVSPNPEMKALVEDFDLGAVSQGYTAEEFARAILSIDLQKIEYYKNNANRAAQIINDEEEQKKILKTVNSLLCVA